MTAAGTEGAGQVPSGPGRPRKGAKGMRTERVIKDAARRVIARDGYLSARITDIAREAGKSPATLYNYFDSKRAILEALLGDFLEILSERTDTAARAVGSSQDSLRAAVAAFWHSYREFRPELVGVMHAAAVDEGFLALWLAVRDSGVQTITRSIVSAQDRGRIDPAVPPEVAASALSAMLEYTCYLWLGMDARSAGRPRSDEEAIDTLTYLWARAIGLRAVTFSPSAPASSAVGGVVT